MYALQLSYDGMLTLPVHTKALRFLGDKEF